MKVVALLSALCMVLFVAGCGSNDITGKWIMVNDSKDNFFGYNQYAITTMDITKNGDSYIDVVTTYKYDMDRNSINDKEYLKGSDTEKKWDYIYTLTATNPQKLGATFKDNQLNVSSPNNGIATLTYIEKDDTLVAGDLVYKRVKNNDEINNIKEDVKKKLTEQTNEILTKNTTAGIYKGVLNSIKFNDDIEIK